MAKKPAKKKTSERVIKDLKPVRNPKGGLSDIPFTHPIDKSTPILH